MSASHRNPLSVPDESTREGKDGRMNTREWLYAAAFDYADAQGATYDEVSAFAFSYVEANDPNATVLPPFQAAWINFKAADASGSTFEQYANA